MTRKNYYVKKTYYCSDCGHRHKPDSLLGKYHSAPVKRTIFLGERCRECYTELTEERGVKLMVWTRMKQMPSYAHVHPECLTAYLSRNESFIESTLEWDLTWESLEIRGVNK